jgi:UDP-3-O-[3-hydroxymyristoyl] glucosamine N-acyltransferase
MSATLAELARLVRGTVRGDGNARIERVASIERAGPGDIVFAVDNVHAEKLNQTSASAVIVRDADAQSIRGNALVTSNPQLAFAQISAFLHPETHVPGVHPAAVVDPGAKISPQAFVGPRAVIGANVVLAERAWIGPGCVIGQGVTIGAGTRLNANVIVQDRCVVGADCLLQAGAVVGSDGFGFARDEDRWIKQPQLGRVVIRDHVEIGANTTVDRGTLDDTVIGEGVKIDNLVHIAHNVRIGDNTAIAACVGIAGSTVIGKRCTIAGQVGIIDHLVIADDVHITADSLVTNSITQSGTYSSSLKAEPANEWRRTSARLRGLDEFARRLRELEKKLERLFTKE